jgi:hypothetical protein
MNSLSLFFTSPLVVSICWLAVVVVYASAFGRWIWRHAFRDGLNDAHPLEKGLFYCALGLGFVQYIPYMLGMQGSLTPYNIALAFGVIGLIILPDITAVSRSIITTIKKRVSTFRITYDRFPEVLLTLLFCAALFSACVVDQSGSDDGYHLTAPKLWLQQKSLALLPTRTHTTAPSGMEMLYTIPLSMGHAGAAKSMHLLFGILSALAVSALCFRIAGTQGRYLGSAFYLLMQTYLMPLTTLAYNDLPIIFYTLVSVTVFWMWMESKSIQLLYAHTLFLGISVAFKLISISIAIGLLSAAAVIVQGGTKISSRHTVCILLCLILPVAPWLFRSFILTGDPFYPALGRFLNAGMPWRAEHTAISSSFFRLFAWAPNRNITPEVRLLMIAAGCVVSASALLLALRRVQPPVQRYAIVSFCITSILFLVTVGFLFRYYYAILITSTLLLLCALVKGNPNRIRHLPIQLGSAAIFLFTGPPLIKSAAPDLPLILGHTTHVSHANAHNWTWYRLWQEANRIIPKNESVILCCFYRTWGVSQGSSFWCDRMTFVTDPQLQYEFRLDSLDIFITDLQRHKVRYAIMPLQPAVRRLLPAHPHADNEIRVCSELVQKHGSMIGRAGEIGIYRLEF